MKIALCNITKGDEELDSLKRMVLSVVDYVDDVYITTNREHTRTKQWCKDNDYHHSHLPWNDDFSEQRNFNFKQAGSDYDYLFWLDSDDVLVGGEHLRALAKMGFSKKFDAIFLDYWYGCRFDGEPSMETLQEVELEQYRERLIKPNRMMWKKRLHETPVEKPGIKYRYSKHRYQKDFKPMAVLHLGADRAISKDSLDKRMIRNQRLMELQLKDELKESEADPRTLLYLMKIYTHGNNVETLNKCLEMGREYLSKSGWDEERAVCSELMAQCYGKLGMDNEAMILMHNSIKEWPHQAIFYLLLAKSYYNLKQYKKMEHWMELGKELGSESVGATMNNPLERKRLIAELELGYYLHVNKNTRKAYEAAKELNKINPEQQHQFNEDYLFDLWKLDDACRNVDKLCRYLDTINEQKIILDIIDSLPASIKKLPFSHKIKNKFEEPRRWKKNEICYFANFLGEHFEKWSAKSLTTGVGGSETAVIELSQLWTKQGYKVTVYGDPGKDRGNHNGVNYLPYYEFNKHDRFNIFISWRWPSLINSINCKKFYVDLHDIWNELDYIDSLDFIDKLMVKSQYQRMLGPNIADDKFLVISNGINL